MIGEYFGKQFRPMKTYTSVNNSTCDQYPNNKYNSADDIRLSKNSGIADRIEQFLSDVTKAEELRNDHKRRYLSQRSVSYQSSVGSRTPVKKSFLDQKRVFTPKKTPVKPKPTPLTQQIAKSSNRAKQSIFKSRHTVHRRTFSAVRPNEYSSTLAESRIKYDRNYQAPRKKKNVKTLKVMSLKNVPIMILKKI